VGDALKRLRSELSSYLLVAFLAEATVVLVLWWLFTNVWIVDMVVQVSMITTLSLVSAILLTIYVGRLFIMPLEFIAAALGHLDPGDEVVSSPNIKVLKLGKELTEQVTKRIYQLAGEADITIPTDKKQTDTPLSIILELMPALIIALDTDGKIAYINKAAARYIDPNMGEPKGKSFDEVFQLNYEGSRTLEQWRNQAEAEKITDSGSWQRVKHSIGEEHVYYFDMAAFYSKDEPTGFETIIALIDHTPRYQADQSEMGFVSLAVHELRTPITVLRGYIEVFEQELGPQLDEELKSFVSKMSVSAEQLSMFINNILNVSRIDNNQMTIKRVELDWANLLRRSMKNDFDLRAKVHNRSLKAEIPENVPTVAADPVSMYEVLSNLVDNAIKYSHDGGQIIIRVVVKNDDTVETIVQDFGIGIPQSVMGNLFEKFYRSHRSRQSVGGTGLGLFLSKTIIEAHSGNIQVQSTEGEGSIFSFSIPTYASVADSIDDPHNGEIERGSHGWIKNHTMHRR